MTVIASAAVFTAPAWIGVANLAALKALPAGAYQSATTRGYAAAGDGGGTGYVWDAAATGADDGGGTISPITNPAAGRWKLADPVNIDARQFGVVFTSAATFSVNNSPRLQAALDHLRLQGGGHLKIASNLLYCDIVEEIYLGRFISITGNAFSCLRRFGVPASDMGFLAIRDPAGTASRGQNIIDGLIFQQFPIAAEELSATATAGQTDFAITTTGATAVTSWAVSINDVLQSPSNGGYTVSGTGITLTTPATAGQVVRIAKTRPSARNAAIYSEGVSAAVRNANIVIRNCRVLATPALYVGLELLWTNSSSIDNVTVTGVANRAAYVYGGCVDINISRVRVSGSGSSGVFAGQKCTSYGVDNNAYDATNTHVRVAWSNVNITDCYRGASWTGTQTNCTFNGGTVDGTTTVGCLVQDTATTQSDGLSISNLAIISTGNEAVSVSASRVKLDQIRIDTCSHGVVWAKGALGTTETGNAATNIYIRGASIEAVLARDQTHLHVDGLYIANSQTAIRTLDTNNCVFAGVQTQDTPTIGIRFSGTCNRNDVPAPSLSSGGIGILLESGTLDGHHTIRDSRIHSFATPVMDNTATSIVRFTDRSGVSQAGGFTA